MTGGALIDEVLRILQEPSVTRDDALAWLQRGADDVSSRVLLPALEARGEVTAMPDEVSVPLPADYQRGLFRATDQKGWPKLVLNGNDRLRHAYGASGRRVRGVVAAPPLLQYAPSPKEPETLVLYYYRKPLVFEDDEVDFLPADYTKLLVHFAAWTGFSLIEQGLEGKKQDTLYYKQEYYEGVEALRLYVREGESLPAPPLSRCTW